MARELLLLRHGKSDWDMQTDDFDRPIKKRGRQAAKKQGIWLKSQGLMPDTVLCSPAKRAQQTAELCCAEMGVPSEEINYDQHIYMANLSSLLTCLEEVDPAAQRLLLIGHNPGMEQLVDYLSAPPIPANDDGKLMPTATLAHLSIPGDCHQLQRYCAKLVRLLRPSELD